LDIDEIGMSEEPRYRIRVKFGSTEIEVQGDKEFVESKFNELLQSLSKEITAAPEQPKITGERISFPEFIAEKSRNIGKDPANLTGPQKMMSIAYYIYKYESRDFSYDDVAAGASEARLSGLTNPRQYTSDLIKKGYLQEVQCPQEEKKKCFRILRRGIQFIESNFQVE